MAGYYVRKGGILEVTTEQTTRYVGYVSNGDGKALQSRRWFTLRVVAGVILARKK